MRRLIGFVDFDANVLAIMTSTPTLAASDFLANVSATYLNPAARGLETAEDTVVIDPGDRQRILIDFTASTPGDYVRVRTAFSPGAAVPAPPVAVLLGLGLAVVGLGRTRRTRRRRASLKTVLVGAPRERPARGRQA